MEHETSQCIQLGCVAHRLRFPTRRSREPTPSNWVNGPRYDQRHNRHAYSYIETCSDLVEVTQRIEVNTPQVPVKQPLRLTLMCS